MQKFEWQSSYDFKCPPFESYSSAQFELKHLRIRPIKLESNPTKNILHDQKEAFFTKILRGDRFSFFSELGRIMCSNLVTQKLTIIK